MDKFLDLIYFGEIGLMSLKRDRTARAQFLEMAKAELSEIVYQLLKVLLPSIPLFSLFLFKIIINISDCCFSIDPSDALASSYGGSRSRF